MRLKTALLSALSACLIMFNSCANSNTQTSATNLSAEAFYTKMKESPLVPVIDVRTPEEYRKGHLPNAVNIDWNGSNFNEQVAGLDKSQPVMVYCLSGGRSAAAAKQMRANGFKQVFELTGGIMKWRAANLPENTDPAGLGMSRAQFEKLLQSDKMVLVDFYADWCAPCKKMKPYLDEIAETMKDSVSLLRINADDNQTLCKDLKIDALPVLQLYQHNNLVWSNTGFIEKDGVVLQLRKFTR